MASKHDVFAELFSKHQLRLFGYVFGLVRSQADARDIVQQTAITAWQKFDQFDTSTDFFRWTVTIAKYEALRFLTYQRRSAIYFDDELMTQLGEDAAELSNDYVESEFNALSQCLHKLTPTDAKLVECRYELGLGTRQISELLDRTQSSVCNSLKRIRSNLARCIEMQLVREEKS
ncbi:sigma-70 family RNA polymerase sigma factor [Aeoliella mucimassa]|uniref:RNA polymerase sigma factor CarQ n=1 Tax=Aeoliella mucimassa TaxID=2527972 RepID=A0A518ARK6_9BACT|nr:sigma-70 family RNA polymerase sigma factor [Aeoliella mucimassa]QDU57359.1 RNA polymerase sigma factor CarQ [Aeoliella mucimassa]